MNEVKEFIVSMSDDDLVDMVEENYYNYTSEALKLAIEELNKRNIQYRDMSQYFPSEEDCDDDDDEEENEIPIEEYVTVLKCPNCELDMKPGKLYLKSTLGSRGSYKNCYFMLDDQIGKEIKIIDNYEKKEANFCCKCGLLIINTRK